MIRWLVILMLPLWFAAANGAELHLSWNEVKGATGYKIYQSDDLGASWTLVVEPTETSVMVQSPDEGLVLWRVSAYNASGEVVRHEAGAWYNGDWITPIPGGLRLR